MELTDSQRKIFVDHFTNIALRRRQEAITLLEQRKFKELNDNYWSSIKVKSNEERIEIQGYSPIPDLIGQLQSFQHCGSNESEKEVSFEYDETDFGINIYLLITSTHYFIRSIEEVSRIPIMDSIEWKIKYQPNGKDTKRYLEILKRYESQ